MQHNNDVARLGQAGALARRRLADRLGLDECEAGRLYGVFERTRTFGPGSAVFQADDPCDFVALIVSGWAHKSTLLEDGRRQIFNFELPGDLIGASHYHAHLARYTCETLTDCALLIAPIDKFTEVAEERPSVGRKVHRFLEWKSSVLHEHLINLGRRTAQEAMAHLLLELAVRCRRIGEASDNSYAFPVRQRHLSDALGITEVHVSRTFRALHKQGLFEVRQGRVTILDEPRAAAFAGFDAKYLDIDYGDP